MQTITFEYGPKKLYLYFNGEAMFQVEALDAKRAEDQPEVLERMQSPTAEGFRLLSQVAVILATQGELCRRYLQYTPERIPSAEELLLVLTPMQMLGLRTAVLQAVNAGWSKTTSDGEGDLDTGLAELEKKTKL